MDISTSVDTRAVQATRAKRVSKRSLMARHDTRPRRAPLRRGANTPRLAEISQAVLDAVMQQAVERQGDTKMAGDKQTYEVQLTTDQMAFIRSMNDKYEIPDESKTFRVVID